MQSTTFKTICPACGSSGSAFLESCQPYDIYRCQSCRLSFSHPMRAGNEDYYKGHFVYARPDVEVARRHYRSVKKSSNVRLLDRLSPGSRVLDVGCGYGAFVQLAIEMGMDAHGIDMNDESVRIGRDAFGLGERLAVLRCENVASELEGRRGSFDLVTLFEVIEHVQSPQELLDQARALLRPGGLLCITCPNEARWQPFGRLRVDYPPHHLTRWRPDTLRSFLEGNGLEYVDGRVESSLRDVIWSLWVNRSIDRLGAGQTAAARSSRKKRTLRRRALLAADGMLRFGCLPMDAVLRTLNVGTLGQRIVMRKAG